RMRRSAPRRDVRPAWARTLLSLSVAIGGDGNLRNDQLALHLRQVVEVTQAEGDEEVAGSLVQERPARRILAAGDANEPPLEQAVEDTLGVDAAHGIDFGPGHRLTIRDDRQCLHRGP